MKIQKFKTSVQLLKKQTKAKSCPEIIIILILLTTIHSQQQAASLQENIKNEIGNKEISLDFLLLEIIIKIKTIMTITLPSLLFVEKLPLFQKKFQQRL